MRKNFGVKTWIYPQPVLMLGTYDEKGMPRRASTVVLSTQHEPDVSHETIERDMIEAVIDALYKERYLDDKRFAEAYIRSYARTKSRELIIRELEYRGVGGDWLYDILDEVYDDESLSKDDVIKSLLEKKFRNQDLSDPKTKMRAANFLIRKGFNFGDINSYLT